MNYRTEFVASGTIFYDFIFFLAFSFIVTSLRPDLFSLLNILRLNQQIAKFNIFVLQNTLPYGYKIEVKMVNAIIQCLRLLNRIEWLTRSICKLQALAKVPFQEVHKVFSDYKSYILIFLSFDPSFCCMAVDLSLNTNCFSMTICLNELPSYNLFWRVLFSSIEEFEVAEI